MGQGLGSSSPKQVRYALDLIEKAKYPSRFVEKRHSLLATVESDDLGKSVERWLHKMSAGQIGALISKLEEEVG
jgi:hypothetical protein